MGWANQNFGFCVELHRVCNLLLNTPFIPPLHRDCDPSASLVRPLTWPGRRWRHRGGRVVALVAQRWHTGRPVFAMVAVEFRACSKQSHKGRRGAWSLRGWCKEAAMRHTHRRSRRMDAQWTANGSPDKKCVYIVTVICQIWAMLLPPLSDHCGDRRAFIQRPRQPLSHHGDGRAFTLPPVSDFLCLYNSFGCSRKAQGSCCSGYTETWRSGFRRPVSILIIFHVAQR